MIAQNGKQGLKSATSALSRDTVHIWCASLDQPPEQAQQLAQTLSGDEQLRSKRFCFGQHAQRYIIGRGLLRMILGAYLEVAPERVKFHYGARGKPALAGAEWSKIKFNMSHSHTLALVAFSYDREIGVDIEQIRPVAEVEQLVERFFSKREVAMFRSLPADKQLEGFFNCWTRKEAFVKACGDGFSRSLDQFDVSLAPGESARLLSIHGSPQEAARWSLQALVPAAGYVAAVAVAGHGWSLTSWQWPV